MISRRAFFCLAILSMCGEFFSNFLLHLSEYWMFCDFFVVPFHVLVSIYNFSWFLRWLFSTQFFLFIDSYAHLVFFFQHHSYSLSLHRRCVFVVVLFIMICYSCMFWTFHTIAWYIWERSVRRFFFQNQANTHQFRFFYDVKPPIINSY